MIDKCSLLKSQGIACIWNLFLKMIYSRNVTIVTYGIFNWLGVTNSSVLGLWIWSYGYPCYALAQNQSTYIILLVTIHRFIAIRFPYVSQKYCNVTTAKKQVIVSAVFVAIVTTPLFLTHKIVSKTDEFNSTMYMYDSEYTSLGKK